MGRLRCGCMWVPAALSSKANRADEPLETDGWPHPIGEAVEH
jgi:hypothetical protein